MGDSRQGFLSRLRDSSRVTRPFQIGFALGGGAARGLAHIGVLKVLLHHGLVPRVIAGTSAGALVGAAYATLGSMQEVEERFVAFASGDKFRKSSYGMFKRKDGRRTFVEQLAHLLKQGVILGVSVTKPSFIGAAAFDEDLTELLPEARIEDLPLRYAAIATDVRSGREVILTRGALRPAVAASCALPGILPPVEMDGATLIDGGSVDKVPVAPTRRMGADFVIAVDIHADLEPADSFTRGIDIVSRSHAITGKRLLEMLLAEADVVIRPEVGPIHWADFGRYAEIIRLGEDAARAALHEIDRRLIRARWRAFLSPWTRPAISRDTRAAPDVERKTVTIAPPGLAASAASRAIAARAGAPAGGDAGRKTGAEG